MTAFAPLLALLTLLLGVLLPASSARAADTYQYWGFYQLTGTTWGYSQVGSDKAVPADGSVDGWRFAIVFGTDPRLPRVTPTFAQVCSATPAQAGKKRVGVVIDFGREADAPAGATAPASPKVACAVVDTKATSAAVLAAVGQVRGANGLICGIDGFPATGCGDKVATVSDAAKAKDEPLAAASGSASASGSESGSASGSASSSSMSSESASSSASASPAASPSPATSSSSSSNSGSNTTGWVVGLALLASAIAVVVTARRRQQNQQN